MSDNYSAYSEHKLLLSDGIVPPGMTYPEVLDVITKEAPGLLQSKIAQELGLYPIKSRIGLKTEFSRFDLASFMKAYLVAKVFYEGILGRRTGFCQQSKEVEESIQIDPAVKAWEESETSEDIINWLGTHAKRSGKFAVVEALENAGWSICAIEGEKSSELIQRLRDLLDGAEDEDNEEDLFDDLKEAVEENIEIYD